MARGATITVEGQAKLKKEFKRLLLVNRKAAVRATNVTALNIQRRARKKAPSDTGRLRSDIRPFFFSEGLIAEINTSVEHAPSVEFGTGPHKSSRGAAKFKRSIERWARRHGIPEEAVFPIMQKIREEGTRAKPFLRPSFDVEAPKYLKRLKAGIKLATEGR